MGGGIPCSAHASKAIPPIWIYIFFPYWRVVGTTQNICNLRNTNIALKIFCFIHKIKTKFWENWK